MGERSAEALVHYLSPHGGMLHAIAAGFGTLDARGDWSKVTCPACLAHKIDVRESLSLAALTEVIFGHVGPLTWTSRTEELAQVQLARSILGSAWLADVVAQAKAEALREAADVIEHVQGRTCKTNCHGSDAYTLRSRAAREGGA